MKSAQKLKLFPIHTNRKEELDWLYRFVHAHHSVPKFILPTREELGSKTRRFFRAEVLSPKKDRSKVIGVTGYEIRTPYLVETQKTIIAPEFRGKGWGRLLSMEVENAAARAGYFKIRSCIYVTNLAMIQIKLAQGYIIEGFHPDHDGPGLHEYSFGKRLKMAKAGRRRSMRSA